MIKDYMGAYFFFTSFFGLFQLKIASKIIPLLRARLLKINVGLKTFNPLWIMIKTKKIVHLTDNQKFILEIKH